MIKKAVSAILSVVTLLLCFGCNKGERVFSKTFFAMGTMMKITLYDVDEMLANQLFSVCYDEILREENLFSVNIAASDVARINASKGDNVNISQETVLMIKNSVSLSRLTEGAFDITVYPVVKLWGFYSSEYAVPENDDITKALGLVGNKNIEFYGSSVTMPENSGIDLGAIAKGYLGDRLKSILKENGVESAVISLGGNVILIGNKANGEPWSVAIKSPFSQNEFIYEFLSFGNLSVVTSGAYERYFEKNGKIYHHIIDPKTGFPADSDLASVTIIGEDGSMCDALSTALFIMGKEKALTFLSKLEEISYVLVTNEREIIKSENLS